MIQAKLDWALTNEDAASGPYPRLAVNVNGSDASNEGISPLSGGSTRVLFHTYIEEVRRFGSRWQDRRDGRRSSAWRSNSPNSSSWLSTPWASALAAHVVALSDPRPA